MIWLINIIGLLLIAFIAWWFWFSKPKAAVMTTNNVIEVAVKDGVYDPALIEVKINTPITLRFTRYDGSPCAETVIFSDLNISQQLPLRTAVDIPLTLPKAGEYGFACSMGMYRGKLVGK